MKDFEKRFLEAKTDKDRNAIFDAFVADIDRVIDEARSLLAGEGIIVADPADEWVTIPEYCKRFGIKNEKTVMKWIDRGIVPEKDIRYVPDSHASHLIKAVKHAPSSPLS